jgi:hypothetical protein
MARALYILVSILLFPFMMANLAICAMSTMIVMGLTDDSSLALLIVWLLIALFFWGGAGATARVLSGEAPAWMRVLWLPGLIGNIASVYLFFICVALQAREPSLALFSPDALARLSGGQLLFVAAGTVGMVASVPAMAWLGQWGRAMARAKGARSVVLPRATG